MDADSPNVVENLYRRESGRLRSVLISSFGAKNIEVIEDAIQDALLRAIEAWRDNEQPENPTAWLYRVARNRVIDLFRKQAAAQRKTERLAAEPFDGGDEGPSVENFDEYVRDGQLRMMFACCHEELPAASRVSLTLNSLCGFTAKEITSLLLTKPEATRKQLYRAKQAFASGKIPFGEITAAELQLRIESVHAGLYALFTEGYNSTTSDTIIRADVCAEAVRLVRLLLHYPNEHTPVTHALLALMLFHAARLESRVDNEGGILLTSEQDRSKWDQGLIAEGFEALSASAAGNNLTRYHLEAGIAAEHCRAPSLEDTDWTSILKSYDRLMEVRASPVAALNRAIVIAHLRGPEEAIQEIRAIRGIEVMSNYHFLDATLGELHFQCGRLDEAKVYFARAAEKANTGSEVRLIQRKLELCEPV